MDFITFLLYFVYLLRIANTQNYCRDLESVTGTQCCSGGSCCQPTTDTSPRCCCDELCFHYGDCCLDILDTGCNPPAGKNLPDFCGIYSSLYTCASKGLTGGCCENNCTVSSPSGTCCSCDVDCFVRGDCCSDISTIECSCINTCESHGFLGCCSQGPNYCHTNCPNFCFCDEYCHYRGDCCSDIEDVNCRSPLTLPPIVACNPEEFQGIKWSQTLANETAHVDCDPTRIGSYTRDCILVDSSSGKWSDTVISNCRSRVLVENLGKLQRILNGTARFSIEEQNDIIRQTSQNSSTISARSDTQNFPLDVQLLSDILSTTLQILFRNSNETISSDVELLDVINNLLNQNYEDTWKFLSDTGGEDGSSRQLMDNIEQYGKYNGQVLLSDNANLSSTTLLRNKSNIDVHFNFLMMDSENYTFHLSHQSSEISKSGSATLDIHTENLFQDEPRLVVVSSIVKNIGSFLLSSAGLSNETAGTDVVTAQVFSSDQQVQTGVSLSFITKALRAETKPRCAYWNYTIGNWSEDGITTISVTRISSRPFQYEVICNSTHTTPFIVLVDSQDVTNEVPEDEYLALAIFSYIGVTMSSICLVLSIIALLTLGKEMVTSVQFFIHFNLSISLLVGYLIYLFFIDDKLVHVTESRAGCAIVAVLLHYFFLAAFSWMLCEGIMLFLLLVLVFSTISKRWYIFLLIGWGLPTIPVIVSVGVIHDSYGVSGRFCWLDPNKSGATWAFVGPMILFILINIFFLIASVRALFYYHRRNARDKNEPKKGRAVFKSTILGTITLIPLLGITWLLGVFSVTASSTVFAWLFVFLASTQGVFIFFINIARNPKVKESVMACFCKKRVQRRKSKVLQMTLEKRMSRQGMQMSFKDVDPD